MLLSAHVSVRRCRAFGARLVRHIGDDVGGALFFLTLAALALLRARAALRLLVLGRSALRRLSARRLLLVGDEDAVILQDEVEVALGDIGTHEHDAHRLTEAVGYVRRTADERVEVFAVLVVVVDHARYVHESFDAVIELAEDAERRDAADDGIESVADKLRHVLDLLHVLRLALRLDGDALTRRGVLSDLGQEAPQAFLPLRRDRARRKRLAQQAMHDEVGIAADRRREVRVVTRSESVVAERRVGITRLLHRAQRDGADDALLRPSLDLFQDLLHVLRRYLARLVRHEVQRERRQKIVQPLDLLVRRLLVHAVEERLLLLLHVLRDGLVRREHALLDHRLCERPRALDERDGLAALVELHLDFGHVEADGTALMPRLFHRVMHLAKRREKRQEVGILRAHRIRSLGENLVDERIGQATIDVYDDGQNLVALDESVCADLHLARHRQAVFARVQAAYTVRELLRQHGNHAVDEVDARAACTRLAVER